MYDTNFEYVLNTIKENHLITTYPNYNKIIYKI